MYRYLISFCCLLSCLVLKANDIEIRYHLPGADNVTMIWGVNDWDQVPNPPPGTVVKNKVMNSPMIKIGDDFIIHLNLPDSTFIDYIFQSTKKRGPFGIRFTYLDYNSKQETAFYHHTINGNAIINLNPDLSGIKPYTDISQVNYASGFFLLFTILALLMFFFRKTNNRRSSQINDSWLIFFSIFLTLITTLTIIRVIVTGTGVNFLSSPFHSIPLIFKTAGQDFLYSGLLTVLFGLLMLLIRRWRTIILWLYGILALISVIIGILNIKITSLLGRPFTYQWLYYSDFLSSTDAKKAISSNFDADTLKSFILLLCITLPMVYFYYHFIRRKKYLLIMMFILFCLMGYLSENDQSIETTKKENPVTYFVLSAIRQNGGSIFSLKKSGVSEEFLHKNKNIIPEQYASAINNKGIKNVIIYVFESLPAEFVTPFNRKYNATPFLDSIKSSAVLFDRIYAHAPATNKSMLSILCGMYPYLSYKLITVQKPDIKWPSVSDELKKSGYETSFFNSGDNRFSGAEDFLQHRGFSDIFDFRTIPCNSSTYSDIRYRNQNLEGVSDSCLSLGFFNWLAKNESKPFFSMMWTYQTHYPYFVSGKTINFNTGNNLLERYLNALHQSDATLKQIVTGLKDRDLLNSTLIVILGDHGEAFGKHGQTGHAGGIYDENLHIPLMFINPGLFHGEYINETGGISDIAPTILSILNKPVPEIWQGENLLSENRRKRVYFFSPYSDILFGFREDQYKFIYNATSNTYYLYDLLADPHESVNIINKKKQYAEESKKHLHEWIQYQLKFVIPFLK